MERKIILLIGVFYLTFAQVKWQKKFEPIKAFIKNVGQFNDKSLYVYDGWNQFYYFNTKNIVIELNKKEMELEENPEEHWEIGKKELKLEKDFVILEFVNANPNVQVIPEGKNSFYHIYSYKRNNEIINTGKVNSFRKLIYKEIYPNIDVEFTLPEAGGLKYTIILHPGARIEDVKIKYNKPVKLQDGKIYISSKFGDLIDHSPTAYYKNNKKQVAVNFVLQNKTISFELGVKEIKKEIVIDPWIETPSLPNSHKVWEVETDFQGNVYAYGGDNNVRYLKYNNAGALQWNYNTGWDSSSIWIGGCIVNPTTGESYLSDGTGATVVKLSPAGSVLFSNTNTSFTESREYWTFAFSCDLSELVNGGTLIEIPLPPTPGALFVPFGVIRQIDMNSGNMNNEYKVGFGSQLTSIPTDPTNFPGPDIQEVSSIANSWTDKNTYYFLTIDSVGAFNTTTGNLLFKIPHNHQFYYYFPGYGIDGTKQPVSLIATGYTAFYTSAANVVEKRDLYTGNVITSASIPGGLLATTFGNRNTPHNGGIDLDTCENVYVGSINQLVKYDKNLNQLNTYPTNFAIYDVDVTINGEVAVGGSNTNTQTAYVALINTNACNPIPYECKIIVDIIGPDTVCLGDTVIYYAIPENQSSYFWDVISNNATIIGSNSLDSVIVYFNTVDSVTLQLVVNGTDTAKKGIIVVPKNSDFSGPQQVCSNSVVTYTANNTADSYLWEIIQGNATIQGSNNQQSVTINTGTTGQFIIQLTTTNANKCVSITKDTITVIQVSDSIIGPRGVCVNSTITYSANVSGLNYQWNITQGNATIQGNNNQQSVTINFPTTGQVTLQLITTNGNCKDTSEAIINVFDNMTITILGPDTICQDNEAIFVLNSNVTPDTTIWNILQGNPNIIYKSKDTLILQFNSTGQYTIEAIASTDVGCKDTTQFTFQVEPPLNLQLTGSKLACIGDNLTFTASANGNPTFVWNILQGNVNIISQNNNILQLEFPTKDTVIIKLTAVSSCKDSIIDTIFVVDSPLLELIADTVCYGDTLWFTAKNDLPNGTIEWYYDNNLTNPITPGNNVIIQGDSLGIFPATSALQVYAIWKHNITNCASNVATITGEISALPSIDSVIVNPPLGEVLILPNRTVSFDVNISALPPTNNNWTYIWDFGDGTSQQITNTNTITHQYPEQEGEYYVYIRVENPNNPECYDTIRIGKVIIKADYTLFIPNVFTPNGDGVNDTWFPVSNGMKEIKITIYDRWGNEIWTTNNLNDHWKGTTTAGSPLPEGVYIYVVDVTFINNKKITRTGSVTLIR